MKENEKRPRAKIRIVYDSGYTHDFWVYSFSVKNGIWNWESVSTENDPIVLGVNNIIAVWQIGIETDV